MTISIIIPVFNRPDEVDELLCSLASEGTGRAISNLAADSVDPHAACSLDFEVVIVEDGSTNKCDAVVKKYTTATAIRQPLNIKYFFKENSGPGLSRNYGAERATGDYLIFLDSDCVVPPGWLAAIDNAIKGGNPQTGTVTDQQTSAVAAAPLDAWGGPDRAADDFTPLQKAVNYAMTSPLTTGGIRGGSKSDNGKNSGEKTQKTEAPPRSLDKFHPRSFNMGVRREVFERVGGFANMRFGEDIDLSYRILEAGFATRLLPEAWVWHKRRTRWRQFFKQVFNSGSARVALSRLHPGTLKAVHLLPAAFTVGAAMAGMGLAICAGGILLFYTIMIVTALATPSIPVFGDALLGATLHVVVGVMHLCIYSLYLLPLYALWAVAIFVDAWRRTRHEQHGQEGRSGIASGHRLRIALMAVLASFIQLTAYGLGFLRALFTRKTAFTKNFYK